MDRKQVNLNPLELKSKTMEEVLKKKEKFGEMIAEKERMSVLKELIDRNKESDDIMLEEFESQEVVQTSIPSNLLPPHIHLPETEHSPSLITTLTTSSPDLDYYYSKNNQQFVYPVPRLDLSWLDNEDEVKDIEEGGLNIRVRSFNEDSFSSEDFHYKEFTNTLTIKKEKLSSRVDEKPVEKSCYSGREHFYKSGEKRENDIEEEIIFNSKENYGRFLNCKDLNQVILKQPNFNVILNGNASQAFESLHINDKYLEKSIEKKMSNDSEFKEIKSLSKDVKNKEAQTVLANNNHNEEQTKSKVSTLHKSKTRNKFLTKFSRKPEKKSSDFSCKVEEKSEKGKSEENNGVENNEKEKKDEENHNVNSDKGEGDKQMSEETNKEVVEGSMEKTQSEVVIRSNDIIKAKAYREMMVMEGWREGGKKKESFARCYCFLCGVNCGIWFC